MKENKYKIIDGKKYFLKPFEGCIEVKIKGKKYYTDVGFFDLKANKKYNTNTLPNP